MAKIILKRGQQDPGVLQSVVHGWHSKEDFSEWPNPEVALAATSFAALR